MGFLTETSHQKPLARPIFEDVLGVDIAARMLHRTPTPFGGLA